VSDDLFDLSAEEPTFEQLAHRNGTAHWREADLRRALGYESPATFRKVIQKAQSACLALGIPIEENFILGEPETLSGTREYHLNRFACFLTAMNGDPHKREVAAAQAYFAAIASAVQEWTAEPEDVERVLLRAKLTDGTRLLNSVAKQHGLEHFGFFHDAGYCGMYNMSLRDASLAWREVIGSYAERNAKPDTGPPFDVRDWGNAANSIGNAAVELRGLAVDASSLSSSDALTAALDRSVDKIFWRAVALIAFFFAALLVYRLIASRVARSA